MSSILSVKNSQKVIFGLFFDQKNTVKYGNPKTEFEKGQFSTFRPPLGVDLVEKITSNLYQGVV